MRLLIDPGHGGENTGCTHNGIVEKEYVLHLGQTLERCVSAAGGTVIMTRQCDETLSLEQRGAIANKAQPHIVVVLHLDSATDPADGFLSCYCLPDDALGRAVGDEIERAAPNTLRPRTPDTTLVRPSDWTERAYNCLRHHAPYPAVLVECGFASNSRHAAYLQTQPGRQALLAALMLGVSRGFELSKGDLHA